MSKKKSPISKIVPFESIQQKIFLIRGHKVMLNNDLAMLYGVPTKRLNEQVRRNLRRFPSDFMFQLTSDETRGLRSQFAASKNVRGGRRYKPLVFTEQGVAMLSSVLNSERAIEVNIVIMRAFARLRGILSSHKDLACKLEELESRIGKHDKAIQSIFEAIRQLMSPLEPPKRRIGFHAN